MNDFEKIARALDLVADDVARMGAGPAPEPTPDPFAAVVRERLGDRATPELVAKIAEDEALRDVLAPFFAAPAAPRSLGGPAEKLASSPQAASRHDQMRAAEEESMRLLFQYADR